MHELWKSVPHDQGYEVSSLGNVRSFYRRGHSRVFETPRPVKSVTASHGYQVVNLRGKVFCVHRLVCEAFHGPRPAGFDVAHADGSRSNNNAENLRWCSRQENIIDAHNHGTMGKGERAQFVILKIEEVREIRRLRSQGLKPTKIAKDLGHPVARVAAVFYDRSWRDVV